MTLFLISIKRVHVLLIMFQFFKLLLNLHFLLFAIIFAILYSDMIIHLKTYFNIYLREFSGQTPIAEDLIYKSEKDAEKLFTKNELAAYNGENNMPIYLSLLGSVFDVTKGSKHYGPGCTYNYFVGRDASKYFITGELENVDEDDSDNVNTLQHNELLSLENWKIFYEKEYILKGKNIGRFYDKMGSKTNYYYQYDALVQKAKDLKCNIVTQQNVYPDCNIEWSVHTGTKVWCTPTSGGKNRFWQGYPRKLYEDGGDNFRCVCVRAEDLDTAEVVLQLYDNCEKISTICYYHLD